MLFAANDGVHGNELWSSDGTLAGTVLVKDLNTVGEDSNTSELVVVNGMGYFIADDGIHGRELWKTDGTSAGTMLVRDIVAGPDIRIYILFEIDRGR